MKNVADIYGLAPLQQLMLVHALSHATGAAFVEQFRCTLTGRLDAAALRGAWDAVVEAHPLLRACFAWDGLKKPVQIVRHRVDLPWTELDWRDASPQERERRMAALLDDDRRLGFDLARAPLARLHCVRTSDDSWQLVWTCHHLLVDGWSAGLVLREVFERYDGALRPGAGRAAPAAGQFRDYLAWLARQDQAAADAFWREHLAGCPAPVGLAIELPPAEHHARSAGREELRHDIPPRQTAELVQLAARLRTSLNTQVQAAWAILLARYAEADDVVLGITVSGRPPRLKGVESIVGPFMNNVPLRVAVRADEPLVELLARLQRQQAEAQPFEHCTQEQIARAAALSDGRPLFDTLLVFENYPIGDAKHARAGELTIGDVQGTASSGYGLSLIAVPGESLSLRLLFDRRRFETPAVQRMLRQLAALLHAIAAGPDSRIGELSLVDDADLAELRTLLPAAGEERVLDAAGRSAPVGLPGELWTLRTRAKGDRGGVPASNGHGRLDPLVTGDRALPLRPTGYWGVVREDGSIECLGRLDAPARIGNYRVDPDEISAVLALHPLVEQVAVAARPDRRGEVHLAAFVVPSRRSMTAIESGKQGLVLEHVRKFGEERLPQPLVPRMWRAVQSLPLDAAGRLDHAHLPDVVRPRPPGKNPYVAPRDALEARLVHIWEDVLGVEPVGVTDSFLDLGGYSSLAVSLVARIGDQFDRRLPLASLFQEPTVAHLAELLRRPPAAPEEVSLVPLRPSGTHAPLFCVHPAGGTVFCYLELAKHLDADVPLYGLQAQGIDGTLAPHESVEQMAEHYARAIKTVQPVGPYHVCGWSTGGVIAFELARQLEAAGDETALLALCDAAIPKPGESFGEEDIVPMLALLFPGEDPAHWQALREMGVERQLADFRQRAELAQLVLAGTGSPQAQRIYDVFQANMKAAAGYRPSRYRGRLTLLRAEQRATPMHADPQLGWGPWAEGGVDVYEMPGSHLEMLQEPAVRRVAEVLRECLATAAVR